MIQTIVKRDGRIVGFNEQKIMAAIRKAMTNSSHRDSVMNGIVAHITTTSMTVDEIERHLVRCGVRRFSLSGIFLGKEGNTDVVDQVKRRIKDRVIGELESFSEQTSITTPVADNDNEEQEPIFSTHHDQPRRDCGVCEDLYQETRDREGVERIRGYGQNPESNVLVAGSGTGGRESVHQRAKKSGGVRAGTNQGQRTSYHLHASAQAAEEKGYQLLGCCHRPREGRCGDRNAPQTYQREATATRLYHAYTCSTGCWGYTSPNVCRSRKRVWHRSLLKRVIQSLDE